VDEGAMRHAIEETDSWNIIYLPTVTKIDLFICRAGAFDQSEFSRRQRVEIREGRTIFIKSPEDTVLRKLLWFLEGDGVSDRQWRDLVQVLRHSARSMDDSYLDSWAERLALRDLLAKARGEAAS
jgi:hypothetical protein